MAGLKIKGIIGRIFRKKVDLRDKKNLNYNQFFLGSKDTKFILTYSQLRNLQSCHSYLSYTSQLKSRNIKCVAKKEKSE